jgi:hypothetical protein
MPGLLRGVARTAVVAGTATSVSNRVSRRQAGRWAAQDQQAYQEQQYAEPVPVPAAAPPPPVYQAPVYQAPPPPVAEPVDMGTKLAQLKELGELRDQGVLSQAEFDTQKANILGG